MSLMKLIGIFVNEVFICKMEVNTMNNFDKIRMNTETIEGMAKMFCSSDWEGKGKVFSKHAARYFDYEEEAIQAEIKWLKQEYK